MARHEVVDAETIGKKADEDESNAGRENEATDSPGKSFIKAPIKREPSDTNRGNDPWPRHQDSGQGTV